MISNKNARELRLIRYYSKRLWDIRVDNSNKNSFDNLTFYVVPFAQVTCENKCHENGARKRVTCEVIIHAGSSWLPRCCKVPITIKDRELLCEFLSIPIKHFRVREFSEVFYNWFRTEPIF